MQNKKKKATAATAVALAAALLLGGTFAWQSISQVALNEKEEAINPGGRLHDDFDGSNKDVYVENFASDPIFARVRLDEYFEFTSNKGTTVADTHVVTEGAIRDELDTYITHLFDAANATDAYWTWTTGGSTVYMPTFNKNKDSLAADINGTFANDYEDYVTYSYGDEITDNAVYDNDSNNVEDDGVTYNNETHTADYTQNAQLISIDRWLELYDNGEDTTGYWVYDTDGWVYWSSPIAPQTATGLLLDGITPVNKFDDSYYYAINVIGQFITADDAGKGDNTGFYDTEAGVVPTTKAEDLLRKIGVDIPLDPEPTTEPETEPATEAPTTEAPTEPTTEAPHELAATVSATPDWYAEGATNTSIYLTVQALYDNNIDVTDRLDSVSWRIENNTSDATALTSSTGKATRLTIDQSETGDITVYATATFNGVTSENSCVVVKKPTVRSLVMFNSDNTPLDGTGTYTAGATNTYTTYFFNQIKDNVADYQIADAYTGDYAELLANSMVYTFSSESSNDGVVFNYDKNVVTINVPEGYTGNITFTYTLQGNISGTITLTP